MSNYEQRDNSGILFQNDRKTKENQPDFTGKCMVNGQEMQVSAWSRETRNGKPMFGLSFSPPYNPDGGGESYSKPATQTSPPDGDIPF